LKKRAEAQFKKVLAYSPNNKDAIKGLGELGIDYASIGKAPKIAAPTSAVGSIRAKLPGAQTEGGEKQSVDPKIVAAAAVGLLVALYFYLKFLGVF
jgi:hypothetical protein